MEKLHIASLADKGRLVGRIGGGDPREFLDRFRREPVAGQQVLQIAEHARSNERFRRHSLSFLQWFRSPFHFEFGAK